MSEPLRQRVFNDIEAVINPALDEPNKRLLVEELTRAVMAALESPKAEFASGPDAPAGEDGTPAWCYDEDGYCIRCGNGRWKHHMPDCELRDLLDQLEP